MIVRLLAAGLLLLFTTSCTQMSNECGMCVDIATRAKKVGTDSEQVTQGKALLGANAYTGQAQIDYKNELNCHWDKYYADANFPLLDGVSPLTTCADTGYCDQSYQLLSFPMVDITNVTTDYGSLCVIPGKIILIHHTVTPTVEDTITTLQNRGLSVQYIVARNGTIYRMVNEYRRAWHAGAGHWREIHDVNSYSTGIEIVNNGVEAFNDIQMAAVENLVGNLKARWHTADQYIVGHMEITPAAKDDPSGWFPWKDLYNKVNVLPGLFDTHLTPAQQQQVFLNETFGDSSVYAEIQNGLNTYGYTYLPMTPNVFDDNMRDNIQSFNRHYCPEVFFLEVDDQDGIAIPNPLNWQWYGISRERLQKLLALM